MIEFGGDKIGYPWHGLYRATTDKITTPAGGDVSLPGYSNPGIDGSTFLIQITGRPAVDTTTAEAASGKTWLNYAIVAGKNGFIYGQAIGVERMIYVDPDGRCWLLAIHASGSRDDGAVELYVRWKRFGLFVDAASAAAVEWVATATKTVGFTLHTGYPVPGDSSWVEIQDISPNGQRLLLAVRRNTVGCAAVVESVFSGSPADGSFDFTLSLLWDEAAEAWSSARNVESSTPAYLIRYMIPLLADPQPGQYGVGGTGATGYDLIGGVTMYWDGGQWWDRRQVHYEYSSSIPPAPPGPNGSVGHNLVATIGKTTQRYEILGGGRYDLAGVPRKITLSATRESEVEAAPTVTLPPDRVTALTSDSGPADGDSTVAFVKVERLVVEASTPGVSISRYDLERAQNWAFVRHHDYSVWAPSGTAMASEEIAGSEGLAVTFTDVNKGGTADWIQGETGFGPGASTWTYPWYHEQITFVSQLPYAFIGVHRAANRVFCATVNRFAPSTAFVNSGGTFTTDQIYCPMAGIDTVLAGYQTRAEFDLPPYATQHPVTGEVVRSDSNVCWC